MKIGMNEEKELHGESWANILDGYFSNSKLASPFTDIIMTAIYKIKPEAIVDLGGGTGFMLNELIGHGLDRIKENIKLINLEASEKQLNGIINDRIIGIQGSLENFLRNDLCNPPPETILYIMRAVLHYFSSSKEQLILKHIRSQMKKNEVLIHQSLCAEKAKNADFLNYFYKKYTGSYNEGHKWAATQEQMCFFLKDSGFNIVTMEKSAPTINSQQALIKRYKITDSDIKEIKDCAMNNNIDIYKEKNGEFFFEIPTCYFYCEAF